jgi:TPR repeat protein
MDEAYDIFQEYCKQTPLDKEGWDAIRGGLTGLIQQRYMPAVQWVEELRERNGDSTMPAIEHTIESLALLWDQTHGKTTAFSKRCNEYAVSQMQILLLQQQSAKARDMRHLADMYRAVQVLGKSNNEVEAVHWLHEAQQLVHILARENSSSVDLFQKIGLENYIDAMIEQGYGWAHYARGVILFSLYQMTSARSSETILKNLVPISDALEKSQTAKIPFVPAMPYLDKCSIDRLIAGAYVHGKNFAKAIEYLARGATKNDAASCFELGCLYLRGFTPSSGQQALDIGISYLERAAMQGNSYAVATLAKFLTNTQEYADKLHQCGGVIPTAMHTRMYKQLKEFMQKDPVRWKPELEIFEKSEKKNSDSGVISLQSTPPVLLNSEEDTLENRLTVLHRAINAMKANASSRSAINGMLVALDEVQKAAGKEKSPEARGCVYSSGAAKEIETFLKGCQDVPLLVAVMTHYVTFANKYGLPPQEHLDSFWAPFKEFERLASNASFNERGINRVTHGIKQDAYSRLIEQLLIAKNKTGNAQFERAYASAHILGVASEQANCSFKSALECLNKSQNKSDAQICYLLSVLYAFGNSVDRHIAKNSILAERYLKQAADNGHSGACVALGIRVLVKNKKSRKDVLEATTYFKRALEIDGNSEARFHLAQIYFKNPELIGNDHKMIYDLFAEAAQHNRNVYSVATIYNVCLALNYPKEIVRSKKDTFADLQTLFVDCLHDKSYDSLIGVMNDVEFSAVLSNFFANLKKEESTEAIDEQFIHYLSALCSFVVAKAETDAIKQRQYIDRGAMLMEKSGQYAHQAQALTVMADVFSEGVIKD